MTLLRSFLLACTLLLPLAGAEAQTTSAADAVVNVQVGDATITNTAVNPLTSSAAGAYNQSSNVASIGLTPQLSSNLVNRASLGVQSGVATTNVVSTGTGGTYSASAVINNANLGLVNTLIAGLIPSNLLSIGADQITSTSTLDPTSNPTGTGFSQLTGLTLGGSLLTAPINGGLFANPDPNTILLNLAGLQLILNEQLRNTGPDGNSLQTNALHLRLTNYSLNNGLVSGDVILGQSAVLAATPTAAVPEVATWLAMILGFGCVGLMLRSTHRDGAAAEALRS